MIRTSATPAGGREVYTFTHAIGPESGHQLCPVRASGDAEASSGREHSAIRTWGSGCRKVNLHQDRATAVREAEVLPGDDFHSVECHESRMHRFSLIIRSIYAACLLGATANHARILFQHGLFWNYGGVAWPSAIYWTSLSILDPLTVLLLFIRPKVGIISTVVLIATNVAHNLAVVAYYAPSNEFLHRVVSSPLVLSQIGFMLFVGITTQIAWKGAKEPRQVRRNQSEVHGGGTRHLVG